jgi:hypothetical protein
VENSAAYEYRNNPEDFSQCISNEMVMGAIDLNGPFNDSLQIWGDCKTVNPSPIRLNQAGYIPQDLQKEFLYVGENENFQVLNVQGDTVLQGSLTSSWDSLSAVGFEVRTSNWAGGVGGGDNRYTMSGTASGGVLKKGNLGF